MKANSRRFMFSDEDKQKYKNQRLEQRAGLSLAYQLGFYVGEQIVNRYLPTLSVDMLQTRNVISVSSDEQAEAERLNNEWFNKRQFKSSDDDSKEEWELLRAYHKMLEEKYLPKTLECHFTLLNINEGDMEEFKKGIGYSLWDCDCSHYNVEEESISVVADNEGYFTVITLKR